MAFLMVMFITAMISLISLVSFLSLSSAENALVKRSLGWNAALPLAEAGVEEALSHVTQNPANYAVDNWTFNGTNYSRPSRTLGSGYYNVSFTGSPGSLLTITSTGYELWKGSSYISRTVRVTAQSGSSIPQAVGLVAKNGISFGGDLNVDSYNSAIGPYNSSSNRGAQAIVETPLGFTLTGNSHVYGSVASGSGGSISTGGNAKVGDLTWNSKGIQPGHSTNNFNAAIPDVVLPYTSAAAPTSGTVSNTSYNYVLSGGNYWATNLTAGGGNTSMIITAPSTLVVTGNVSLASVVFATTNATLDIYIETPSISFCPTISGMTGSQPATPLQFRVWGLPSCTTMDMTAGNSFTGMIYAPEANLSARGHAAFYGAFTSNTFTCNGTFDFHYDVATATYSPSSTSLQIMSWAEK
jgi:Putative Ice-binding-like adhesive domain